jgi:hypothetical protein
MRAGTLKVVPVTKSIQIIPVSAQGSAVIIMNGCVPRLEMKTFLLRPMHQIFELDHTALAFARELYLVDLALGQCFIQCFKLRARKSFF